MSIPIIAWARTPVAPVGGTLAHLDAHELAAPLVRRLLRETQLPPEAVDALVLGNALGAGGNPARLVALASGLPEACAAMSVDSQCCAGLDAVSLACGLLASGQAEVVIAGGAEAWSRAPIRHHRPMNPNAAPQPYEQPAFTPWPDRDPDMLAAAAAFAQRAGWTRPQQDAYVADSHARALIAMDWVRQDIEPLAGCSSDTYPRRLTTERLARMPAVAGDDPAFALSVAAVAPKADGAALILLATEAACRRWGLHPTAHWHASVSLGGAPDTPMRCAAPAVQAVVRRAGWTLASLHDVELHDAFAVQGLDVVDTLGVPPERVNADGGGLARGHPIGASGAIALVMLLARLRRQTGEHSRRGVACAAAAGGIGAAIAIQSVPRRHTDQE